MKGSSLVDFAYPLLQVKRAGDTTFHNLIIQVLVLGLTIATLVMALDHDGERTLVSFKVVQMVLLLGVVLFTGVTLALHSRKREELRGVVSLSSFGVAVVVLVLSASTMASGAERETLWWLELIMTLLGTLWVWRTAGQNINFV